MTRQCSCLSGLACSVLQDLGITLAAELLSCGGVGGGGGGGGLESPLYAVLQVTCTDSVLFYTLILLMMKLR